VIDLLPVISLWNPWAMWVALGWKKIETRTHVRFQSLTGRRIGIHASRRWDDHWREAASVYLDVEQIARTEANQTHWRGGIVVCTADVHAFSMLRPEHAGDALIECDTLRWGLYLSNVKETRFPQVPIKGGQGIFYVPRDLCA